ncbi:hypothetical protein [Helicobacter cynogastricus]|uniref:hypothetical protein n=1 Tax=Helicobacter cynogastricus TaxID=329937 RepID=UPI000CF10C0D|nr:hypothetical protein [Helicobacter cynogastricus]
MSRHLALTPELYESLCSGSFEQVQALLRGKELYIPRPNVRSKIAKFIELYNGQNGLSLCVRLGLNQPQYTRALKLYKKTCQKI